MIEGQEQRMVLWLLELVWRIEVVDEPETVAVAVVMTSVGVESQTGVLEMEQKRVNEWGQL